MGLVSVRRRAEELASEQVQNAVLGARMRTYGRATMPYTAAVAPTFHWPEPLSPLPSAASWP
ncbi:hypothetical protein [Streptomyces sp. NBC_00459]|uniref:hypothetical protein n=1 Tax=Streptomyces sp. NBC_00459 TaxID=2975749 RepID=UPI002E1743F7